MPKNDKQHMETQTGQRKKLKNSNKQRFIKVIFMYAKFRHWCLYRRSAQYLENKFIINMPIFSCFLISASNKLQVMNLLSDFQAIRFNCKASSF